MKTGKGRESEMAGKGAEGTRRTRRSEGGREDAAHDSRNFHGGLHSARGQGKRNPLLKQADESRPRAGRGAETLSRTERRSKETAARNAEEYSLSPPGNKGTGAGAAKQKKLRFKDMNNGSMSTSVGQGEQGKQAMNTPGFSVARVSTGKRGNELMAHSESIGVKAPTGQYRRQARNNPKYVTARASTGEQEKRAGNNPELAAARVLPFEEQGQRTLRRTESAAVKASSSEQAQRTRTPRLLEVRTSSTEQAQRQNPPMGNGELIFQTMGAGRGASKKLRFGKKKPDPQMGDASVKKRKRAQGVKREAMLSIASHVMLASLDSSTGLGSDDSEDDEGNAGVQAASLARIAAGRAAGKVMDNVGTHYNRRIKKSGAAENQEDKDNVGGTAEAGDPARGGIARDAADGQSNSAVHRRDIFFSDNSGDSRPAAFLRRNLHGNDTLFQNDLYGGQTVSGFHQKNESIPRGEAGRDPKTSPSRQGMISMENIMPDQNMGVTAGEGGRQPAKSFFRKDVAGSEMTDVRQPSYPLIRKNLFIQRDAGGGQTATAFFRKNTADPALSGSRGWASNPLSRWMQKRAIQREYAALRIGRGGAAQAAPCLTWHLFPGKITGGIPGKIMGEGPDVGRMASSFVSRNSPLLIVAGFLMLIVMNAAGLLSSCSAFLHGGTGVVADTSFTAEDGAITGAEEDYRALEMALQERIEGIEDEYEGYDEYIITCDQIGHDPYELAAYLTVLFEDYTREEVRDACKELFDSQYVLETEETKETRTRTETRTGTHQVTDPETGESYDEDYDYDVEVEYDYYILNVSLENRGIGAVVEGAELDESQTDRYGTLLETHGNRPGVFGDNPYAMDTEEPIDYRIPGEALTDARFARMIGEAEKYLGYPYVWGGDSPETGFDCSGFVSYVVNHCGNGWDFGRLTAEGLRGICEEVDWDEAEPGDLIFFQGTYGTEGASHVGIYVGDGMMIHCGRPAQYASCRSPYWEQHYLGMGRLP